MEEREPTSVVKILYFEANPIDTPRLAETGAEYREIRRAIKGARFRENIVLVHSPAADVDSLHEEFLEHRPHVVHFSAHHGAVDGLSLHDKDELEQTVPAALLVDLLRTLKDRVRLVLMNACDSLSAAELIAGEVECAVGMAGPVHDHAARLFAPAFYRGVANARSVYDAFRLGCHRLAAVGNPGSTTPRLVPPDGERARGLVLVRAPEARARSVVEEELRRSLDGLPVLTRLFVVTRCLARSLVGGRLDLLGGADAVALAANTDEERHVVTEAQLRVLHDVAAEVHRRLERSAAWSRLPEGQISNLVMSLAEAGQSGASLTPEHGLILLVLRGAMGDDLLPAEIAAELPAGCVDEQAIPTLLKDLLDARTADDNDADLVAHEDGRWRAVLPADDLDVT